MRQLLDLQEFWHAHQQTGRLAICTLVGKQGSSYCAIGAKKLVLLDSDRSCGLLSGGCLEGDIARTAREDWAIMPFLRSFSTLSETDRLLGYQTGCAGVLDILFEQVPTVADINLYLPYGQDNKAGVEINLGEGLGARRFLSMGETVAPENFIDRWSVPLSLTIVGCGSDAMAFAELVPPLGWDLRFFDYRSDHQLPINNPYHSEIFLLNDIASQIPTGTKSAVILMTHNYEADMTVLADLNGKSLGYIGCLGPATRYAQMKQDLQTLRGITIDKAWEKIVRAPPGLLPRQRTPQTIALSIVAEIQQILETDE